MLKNSKRGFFSPTFSSWHNPELAAGAGFRNSDGTVGRVCKSVSGAQRQARLTLAPSGSEITSIKAGLGATFTWFGPTAAAEAGTFHD
jgi:hypothetical protein